MENFDQTTSTALQHWDDHEDLSTYDFSADSMQAPNNNDDKRKLAYRYRLAVAISLIGTNCLLVASGCFLWR